jgi:hypothetical protein
VKNAKKLFMQMAIVSIIDMKDFGVASPPAPSSDGGVGKCRT